MLAVVGRFALRDRRWETVDNVPATRAYNSWIQLERKGEPTVRYRSIGWRVEREVKGFIADDACPAISAWIASMGRVVIWNAMQAAGPHNVYYCDTDGLWVNGGGLMALERAGLVGSDGLGDLRLVGTHDTLQVVGIKQLIVDGKRIGGNVPAIHRIATDGRLEWESALGVERQLEQRRGPQPIGLIEWGRYSEGYRHGVVESDGSVRPYRLLRNK
jgi:hypothetical protein